MAKKPREPRYKTPEGTARYPWLNIPDEYKGKKSWKVELLLPTDSPECTELMEQLDAMVDEAFEVETKTIKKKERNEARKYYPYDEVYDDQDELTGDTVFRFKRTAEYTDRKTDEIKPLYINYYDERGKWVKLADLEDRIGKIGSGSKIQVEYSPFPFYNKAAGKAGVSLRLVGVKINELVTAGGGGQDWDGESRPDEPNEDEPDF